MSAKRCPFCPKVHFLSVAATVNNNTLSCPVCEHPCSVYKEDIRVDTVYQKHAFCPECRILFRVDLDHLHHKFDEGSIYLAQTIQQYAIAGRILQGMPQFASKDVAVGLLDADKIAVAWAPIGPLDECCSCLKPTALATPCGHTLCSACKAKWCGEQGRGCPMCRAPVFTRSESNAADDQTAADIGRLMRHAPIEQITITMGGVEHVVVRSDGVALNEVIIELDAEAFGMAIAGDGSLLVGTDEPYAMSAAEETHIDGHAA